MHSVVFQDQRNRWQLLLWGGENADAEHDIKGLNDVFLVEINDTVIPYVPHAESRKYRLETSTSALPNPRQDHTAVVWQAATTAGGATPDIHVTISGGRWFTGFDATGSGRRTYSYETSARTLTFPDPISRIAVTSETSHPRHLMGLLGGAPLAPLPVDAFNGFTIGALMGGVEKAVRYGWSGGAEVTFACGTYALEIFLFCIFEMSRNICCCCCFFLNFFPELYYIIYIFFFHFHNFRHRLRGENGGTRIAPTSTKVFIAAGPEVTLKCATTPESRAHVANSCCVIQCPNHGCFHLEGKQPIIIQGLRFQGDGVVGGDSTTSVPSKTVVAGTTAIRVKAASNVTMSLTHFSMWRKGGAILIQDQATLKLTDSIIESCRAAWGGSALRIAYDAGAVVERVLFRDNVSPLR